MRTWVGRTFEWPLRKIRKKRNNKMEDRKFGIQVDKKYKRQGRGFY